MSTMLRHFAITNKLYGRQQKKEMALQFKAIGPAILDGRDVATMDIVRAWAILQVAVSHLYWRIDALGGLNILLFLAGYNFARFTLHKANNEIVGDLLLYAKRLAVPSLALTLLYFAIKREIDVYELMFVSAMVNHIAMSGYPVWYPQAIIAIFIALALFAQVFGLEQRLRHAIGFSLIVLAAASIPPLVAGLIQTGVFWPQPQYVAWNFFLGWVVYFFSQNARNNRLWRWLAFLVAIACSYLVLHVALGVGISRWISLSIAVALVLTLDKIRLPSVVGIGVQVIASAAIYIFFLHLPVHELMLYLMSGSIEQKSALTMALAAALVMPVLIWSVVTAGLRAYRRTMIA